MDAVTHRSTTADNVRSGSNRPGSVHGSITSSGYGQPMRRRSDTADVNGIAAAAARVSGKPAAGASCSTAARNGRSSGGGGGGVGQGAGSGSGGGSFRGTRMAATGRQGSSSSLKPSYVLTAFVPAACIRCSAYNETPLQRLLATHAHPLFPRHPLRTALLPLRCLCAVAYNIHIPEHPGNCMIVCVCNR